MTPSNVKCLRRVSSADPSQYINRILQWLLNLILTLTLTLQC